MTCLPMYVMWAKNDFHNYFDKVDGQATTLNAAKRGKKGSEDGEIITLMKAEDFGANKGES